MKAGRLFKMASGKILEGVFGKFSSGGADERNCG